MPVSDFRTKITETGSHDFCCILYHQKSRLFLFWYPYLTIVKDYCTLVKLFGHWGLGDVANLRLFRLKENTLQLRLLVKYLPGKKELHS